MTTIESRFIPIPALAFALVLVACGGKGEKGAADSTKPAAASAQQAVMLTAQDVATATIADITTGVLVTGSLEPAEQVTIAAQANGALGPIRVDRGSRVSRGQTLTTISAEGVRSQAAGARANVAAAEAALVVARTQRDAAQRLYQAGAASRVDAENAQAAYVAAEAQVAAAKAQATAAGEAAGYTVVTSPMSGAVSERRVEPGQAVRVGDELMTIVNTSTLELAGRVPVDQAGGIRAGQEVEFLLDAFPGRTFHGTVARKDPAADPATRQVGVYVRLTNPRGEITAGQFARGQVSGQRVPGAVTVPTTAVVGTGTESAVFVVQGNKLARRAVTLGPRDERAGTIAIATGLQAGERVLARPTATVADGQAVVVSTDNTAKEQGK